MKFNRATKFLTISLAVVLLFAAPSLLANIIDRDTATTRLTGAGSNASASRLRQQWDAHLTNYHGGLSKARSGDQDLYDPAAWLTLQLLSTSTNRQAAHLQFAVWGLLDPSSITHLQSKKRSDVAIVRSHINLAKDQTFAPGQGGHFSIYTPVSGTSPMPQEFLVVRTPEPESIALLLLHFAFLGIVVFYARRRRAGSEA
jgi:hypothetical protein